MPKSSHQKAHATGGNGYRQEQNRRRQDLNNPQNTLLPGKSLLNCGQHFQMRHRQSIHMLNVVYEDDIKIKNKYLDTIQLKFIH
jgi:hypothetical protein